MCRGIYFPSAVQENSYIYIYIYVGLLENGRHVLFRVEAMAMCSSEPSKPPSRSGERKLFENLCVLVLAFCRIQRHDP